MPIKKLELGSAAMHLSRASGEIIYAPVKMEMNSLQKQLSDLRRFIMAKVTEAYSKLRLKIQHSDIKGG